MQLVRSGGIMRINSEVIQLVMKQPTIKVPALSQTKKDCSCSDTY